MRKVLFIVTKRPEYSAERTRVRYFIKALKESEYYSIDLYEVSLSNTLNKLLRYIIVEPPRDLYKKVYNADIVIATSPPILNSTIGYKVAREFEKPLIIDIRDLWEEYAKLTFNPILYNIFLKRLIRTYYEALDYASKLIVTTKYMAKYYSEKMVHDKIRILSNGTDPSIIKCFREKRIYDIVVLADFNSPYHNIEYIIKILKTYCPKLSMLVIGGGKYLNKIVKYARKYSLRTKFVGTIPYNELSNYLCRARVGIVGRPFIRNPEYLFTLPVKTYDYLAAELPIFGYGPSKSYLEEFIRENNIGFYVGEDTSPREACTLLHNLIEHSDEYRRRARSLAIAYDRNVLSKEIINILNDVVS